MKVDLKGKVALVTGAGRNIGKAIADAYAENGARVAYTDIDFPAPADLISQRPSCTAMVMNVTDTEQVEAVIKQVVEEFGSLDILVNNAGINTFKHRVTIDEFPREEWDRIVDVDLTSLYTVSKAAARVMVKQGSGRIINISSVVGLVPLRLQCAFAAAKAGVVNLTKAMAIELASRGVLVNCIAPGSILTDATKKLFYDESGQFSENVKQMLGHIPLGKPGHPRDVANAALFLAAPESGYVNGHILTVDGGWTAGYTRDF